MPVTTVSIVAAAVFGAGGYIFFVVRSLRYLRYFQQEDYLAHRFCKWYLARRAFDRRGSSIALLAGCVSFLLPKNGVLPVCIVAAVLLVVLALREENPLACGKVKLKMTDRAKRIAVLSSMLCLAAAFVTVVLCALWCMPQFAQAFVLSQIAVFQLHPFLLIAANWALSPYEALVQSRYAAAAATKIRNLKPYVIGITGSYGKTSTKMILGHILNSTSPTFYPPGSINTYMGVTRDIRERLESYHKYAVIEMAAYRRGSITKLCRLVHPQAAIITAIGDMHMERFGSKDQVYLAKCELAAAIDPNGVLVVNGDYELCRKAAREHPKRLVLTYGLDANAGPLDSYLHDYVIAEDGSCRFKIRWNGQEYEGKTILLGRHMLSNILGVFTMACALGCKPETVIAAIANVAPQSNRLEPVRISVSSLTPEGNSQPDRQGGILWLNDAFNSNAIGFAAALDVLRRMPAAGRKVLVTPGMVELGDRQYEENRRLAAMAASVCDLVLVVGDTNRSALISGLNEGNADAQRYKVFGSMRGALAYLNNEFLREGDIVLIENDLTDVYEGNARF